MRIFVSTITHTELNEKIMKECEDDKFEKHFYFLSCLLLRESFGLRCGFVLRCPRTAPGFKDRTTTRVNTQSQFAKRHHR